MIGMDNLNEGDKFDERKSRVDLVDPALMHYAALGLEYGAKKYSEWNWRKGIRYSKLYAALLRHLYAWWDGENIDRESGNPHLAHAACMLMMLIRFENDMRYDHLDNRCDVVPANLSPVSDDPDPEDDYIQQPPGELEPVESREYSLHTNCLAKNCYCDQCMFKMRIEGGD